MTRRTMAVSSLPKNNTLHDYRRVATLDQVRWLIPSQSDRKRGIDFAAKSRAATSIQIAAINFRLSIRGMHHFTSMHMRINSFTEDSHHGLIERIHQRKAIQENFAHKKICKCILQPFKLPPPVASNGCPHAPKYLPARKHVAVSTISSIGHKACS